MKTASHGGIFQEDAKDYVINMQNNIRTLHKKNGCYYSKCFYKYYDFDTYEKAKASGLSIRDCLNCFPEKRV